MRTGCQFEQQRLQQPESFDIDVDLHVAGDQAGFHFASQLVYHPLNYDCLARTEIQNQGQMQFLPLGLKLCILERVLVVFAGKYFFPVSIFLWDQSVRKFISSSNKGAHDSNLKSSPPHWQHAGCEESPSHFEPQLLHITRTPSARFYFHRFTLQCSTSRTSGASTVASTIPVTSWSVSGTQPKTLPKR